MPRRHASDTSLARAAEEPQAVLPKKLDIQVEAGSDQKAVKAA